VERRYKRRKDKLAKGKKKEDEETVDLGHAFMSIASVFIHMHRWSDPGVNHTFACDFIRWLISYRSLDDPSPTFKFSRQSLNPTF